jgi:hypothetical protein
MGRSFKGIVEGAKDGDMFQGRKQYFLRQMNERAAFDLNRVPCPKPEEIMERGPTFIQQVQRLMKILASYRDCQQTATRLEADQYLKRRDEFGQKFMDDGAMWRIYYRADPGCHYLSELEWKYKPPPIKQPEPEIIPTLEVLTSRWEGKPAKKIKIEDYFRENWERDIRDHIYRLQRPEKKNQLLQIIDEDLIPLPNGWLRIYEISKVFRLCLSGMTPHATRRTEYFAALYISEEERSEALVRMMNRIGEIFLNLPRECQFHQNQMMTIVEDAFMLITTSIDWTTPTPQGMQR